MANKLSDRGRLFIDIQTLSRVPDDGIFSFEESSVYELTADGLPE